MGPAYTLHTPWALPEALRRGLNTVDDPHRARPFYLLLPINTQPQLVDMNLAALPAGHLPVSVPPQTTAATNRRPALFWPQTG